MENDTAVLILKKDNDRRMRAGHPWVFSNEVDTEKSPLKQFQPGEQVAVINHQGKWMGWAYVNPNSLISARVVSRDQKHPISQSLIVHRLKIALSLRDRLYAKPFYRLVFGDTDGLPGLVVDRYGDYLVLQITTAGMELLIDDLVAALQKVLKPKGILLRNDSSIREMEGLERYVSVAAGEVPEKVEVLEGDCRFLISPHEGQKTGWFYDQAVNRDRLLRYVKDKRVLDVFSYIGAWGVRAAVAGASDVTCIDASGRALESVSQNAEMNGVGEKITARMGDAFSVLRDLRQEKQRFDVVVVDPPAFIKRKKDLRAGTQAYRRINEAALSLLNKDGILVSASCSSHLERDALLHTVQAAARHLDRSLQLLEQGQQGPDHPIHPAITETAYLKALYFRVLPAF